MAKRVKRNQRYGALSVLLVAMAVLMVGFSAEALFWAPFLTHLETGR